MRALEGPFHKGDLDVPQRTIRLAAFRVPLQILSISGRPDRPVRRPPHLRTDPSVSGLVHDVSEISEVFLVLLRYLEGLLVGVRDVRHQFVDFCPETIGDFGV